MRNPKYLRQRMHWTMIPIKLINKEALYQFQTELIKAGVRITDYIDPSFRKTGRYSVDLDTLIDYNLSLDNLSGPLIRPAILKLISLLDTIDNIRFIDLPPSIYSCSSIMATDYGISLRVSLIYAIRTNTLKLRFDTAIEFDKRYVQRKVIADQSVITNDYEEQWKSANAQSYSYLPYAASSSAPLFPYNTTTSVFPSIYMSPYMKLIPESEKKEETSIPESDGKTYLDLDKNDAEIEKITKTAHLIDLE